MPQRIGAITLVVDDYDRAKAFYIGAMGFRLVEDTPLGEGKRWVLVAPSGEAGTSILLAKADGEAQCRRIGNQTGGRVALFLHTDDFWGDHHRMSEHGVEFLEAPRTEIYGIVAVFEDLYGNRWDLLQRNFP